MGTTVGRGTTAAFVEDYGLRMKVRPALGNPFASYPADHWLCALIGPNGRMVVTFSMGHGHNGREPGIEEVLDCLAMDAAGIDNANGFEDWAAEFGFDVDCDGDPVSQRERQSVVKRYNATARQSASLRRILGADAYRELLWDTDLG